MNNFIFNESQKKAFKETQESMGASVENNHLLAGLVERTRALNKCDIIQQKVVEIKRPASEWERPSVKLEDGTVIEADVIVGSDGEKSKTREEYGIKASGYSYEQSGVVCTVSSLRPNTIAF
jgi:2-octaprenyl-6-methoxyphenol hydroxylase